MYSMPRRSILVTDGSSWKASTAAAPASDPVVPLITPDLSLRILLP